MIMRRYGCIAATFILVLGGCFGRQSDGPGPGTDFEREIDAGLDGIEHRLNRLQTEDSSELYAEETLEELRRHRDDLRRELDRMSADTDSPSDSVEVDLRRRLEDLAIRYETARLDHFESRELFQRAVETRFEDLDRELALLEGQVVQDNLQDRFDATIARLYRIRNDVALRVAETAAASEHEFPRMKSELAAAIGKLDLLLAHTTREVDRAFDEEHPVGTLNRLWL